MKAVVPLRKQSGVISVKATAADLATRNKIAVYSVGGCWKNRKVLQRYEFTVRYSLIVTIGTPDNDVDIYSPVRV